VYCGNITGKGGGMSRENVRKVRIYTLSTCPMCKWLKKTLGELEVEYEAIDVDLLKSGEQWLMTKEVKKYNPDATYPTMVVEEVISDYSLENLKKTLGKQ
jgi:glutaredoxin